MLYGIYELHGWLKEHSLPSCSVLLTNARACCGLSRRYHQVARKGGSHVGSPDADDREAHMGDTEVPEDAAQEEEEEAIIDITKSSDEHTSALEEIQLTPVCE